MFSGLDPDGKYKNQHHLAEMIAYMGPPPLEFLERSEESWEYFDRKGRFAEYTVHIYMYMFIN